MSKGSCYTVHQSFDEGKRARNVDKTLCDTTAAKRGVDLLFELVQTKDWLNTTNMATDITPI